MPNRIQINGTSYDIPSGIEEISIKRFIELRNLADKDYITLLNWAVPALDMELLGGNNKQIEQELTGAISLVNGLLNEIYAFMSSDDRIIVPKQIDFLGWNVKLVPGLLTSLPYWPYVQVKTILSKKQPTEDYTDFIPEILAHYLYATVTKSTYNEYKAEAFIEVVNEMPMVEAIQVGNFFLIRYKNLYLSPVSNFLTSLNLLRLRLKLKFLRNMAILTPSKRYPVVIF